MNGTLYFTANDGTNGVELWKSDGTSANTVMVKDIHGSGDSNPSNFIYFNNAVYFTATNATNGTELWKTTGTDAGTVRITDINPNAGSSSPANLTIVNGILYFTATDGTNGIELWQTDGTEANTKLVKDINTGSTSSSPTLLTNVNNVLYFSADGTSTITGNELWGMGNCTITNTIGTTTGESGTYATELQSSPASTTCACDIYKNLITTTKSSGVTPYTSSIDAKAWIESSAPVTYARRHYEINPVTDASTTTGTITLYFTQADFDAYNAITPTAKLPTSSSDNARKSNLKIEQHIGTSSDNTGLPDTYSGNISTIESQNLTTTWNNTASRWEVTFETTGFGGFFLKTVPMAEPTAVAAGSSAICSGSPVALTATCSTGTITWYNQVTGGTALGTGNNLSQSPSMATTYYAACEDGTSVSPRVATSEVNIKPIPAIPTGVSVSNSAICSGTSVSLSATCATGTINWYNQATGGSAIGTGATLSQSPTENTTYYAACESENCFSNRVATNQVVVTIQPVNPTAVSVNKTNVCVGSGISLSATCTIGTITWYNQTTGGIALGTGNGLNQTPEVNTTYFVSCENANCTSSRVATNEVIINSVPANPTDVSVDKTSITSGASVSLTANCATGTITWYNQSAGGTAIGTGNSLSQTPATNITYYVACESVTCTSNRVATNQISVFVPELFPYVAYEDSYYNSYGITSIVGGTGVLYFLEHPDYSYYSLNTLNPLTGNVRKNVGYFFEDYPTESINVGGNLYSPGGYSDYDEEIELYKSDGTSTNLLKDIYPGYSDGPFSYGAYSSYPNKFKFLNGTLYFLANDGGGRKIWKTNGTNDGTVAVTTGMSDIYDFTEMAGIIYFYGYTGSIYGLYKSDGTTTTLIKQFTWNLGPLLTVSNGVLYFIVNDGVNGTELWKSNGTAGGTVMVKNINPNASSAAPTNLTDINNTLYFVAEDGTNGRELWKTNGTEASTVMIQNIHATGSSNPSNITSINGIICFIADDGVHGKELWTTNGTTATLLKEINGGSGSFMSTNNTNSYFAKANGALYFMATTGTDGYKLWKTDGTANGTKLVKDIDAASTSDNNTNFALVDEKLFFTNASNNKRIWTMGYCSPTNQIGITTGLSNTFNSAIQNITDQTTCNCDVYNKLISTVKPSGANPVNGTIDAKMWLDNSETNTYVKRHYEINSSVNDTTATGTVTLYFTQGDFNSYNTQINTRRRKLPANSSDTQAISNLYIEKRAGTTSNNTTGAETTYSGAISTIEIDDNNIVWNGTLNRWEVTFETTGFGGFFVKTRALNPVSSYPAEKTICAGTDIFLSITCGEPQVIWYKQATGGTSVGIGLFGETPTETTTYYATCGSGTSVSERVAIQAVTVVPVPEIPTNVSVNKTAICLSTTVSLNATCATGTITWYNQATGGTAIGTGNSLNQTPTTSTTYYASCETGNCVRSRVATEQVVVTPQPTTPPITAVDKTIICSGTSISLSSVCTIGTVIWYNQASGGTIIGTGNDLTQSPTTNAIYYAACENGECISGRKATSAIIVTAQPTVASGVSVDKSAICIGSGISLSATCATGTITWYKQATGGAPIGIGTGFSQSPTTNTTYYVSCESGNCVSAREATNEVVVSTQTTIPTSVSVNNTAICSGTTVSLAATCATGTITWYNQATGGTAIGTGNSLNQNPATTTTYYASCESGVCISSRVATSQVVVTSQPGTPTSVAVDKTTICSGSPVILTATCATGTITWYNQATGGTAIGTGNSLSQNPTIATTYYAACQNGTCISNRLATNAVTVTSLPAIPTGVSVDSIAICSGKSVILSATCAAGTITWYNQATGGTAIGTGNTLSQSPNIATTYYATCKSGDCFSNRVATSQVVLTAQPITPTSVSVNKSIICSGESVTVSANCGVGTPTWYNTETGRLDSLGTSIGTGSSLVLHPTITTTYIVECRSGNCVSERVASTELIVKPTPSKPVITGTNKICGGENVLLTASSVNSNIADLPTFNWTGGLTGQAITVSPTISRTYKVLASHDGCSSDSSDVFILTVNPMPVATITTDNETICKDEVALLTGTCTSKLDAFYWSTTTTQPNSGSGFNPLSTVARAVNNPGTYKGYCKSKNGCISAEVSIVIAQSANCEGQATITISPAKALICPGSSVTLNASGCSGTINWYAGVSGQQGTAGTAITVKPTTATTYVARCSTGGAANVNVTIATANTVVSAHIATGTNDIKALDTIESSKKVGDPNYSPSANVSFQAGKSITLNPGFVAEYRSTFKAEIQACN
ncbi:ELWxxDGT repeat protein [Emticicia sp. C21]|uniref:ELWxxDGT repeat protein n=1 Tax=Emticicia sp. C21 TaxID=2302915 RepID=UPI000E341EC7|nr:ELWxxDGT repeat protein [Emticicia sp. C21]RFS17744.1 hypothetical protein D0T08_00380 [Emticicia sp. C21]